MNSDERPTDEGASGDDSPAGVRPYYTRSVKAHSRDRSGRRLPDGDASNEADYPELVVGGSDNQKQNDEMSSEQTHRDDDADQRSMGADLEGGGTPDEAAGAGTSPIVDESREDSPTANGAAHSTTGGQTFASTPPGTQASPSNKDDIDRIVDDYFMRMLDELEQLGWERATTSAQEQIIERSLNDFLKSEVGEYHRFSALQRLALEWCHQKKFLNDELLRNAASTASNERWKVQSEKQIALIRTAKATINWQESKIYELERRLGELPEQRPVTVMNRNSVPPKDANPPPRRDYKTHEDWEADTALVDAADLQIARARGGPVYQNSREQDEQNKIDRAIKALNLPIFSGNRQTQNKDEAIFANWYDRIRRQISEGSREAKRIAIVSALRGPAWEIYDAMPAADKTDLVAICKLLDANYSATLSSEDIRHQIYNLKMGAENFDTYNFRCANLFNMRNRVQGDEMPENEKKECMFFGLSAELQKTLKLEFPMYLTRQDISYNDYVNNITPYVREWETTRPQRPPLNQSFQRRQFNAVPRHQQANQLDIYAAGHTDLDSTDHAEQIVDDILNMRDEHWACHDWEQLCMLQEMGKLTCFICLKEGHSFRQCTMQPNEDALKRIDTFRRRMREKRAAARRAFNMRPFQALNDVPWRTDKQPQHTQSGQPKENTNTRGEQQTGEVHALSTAPPKPTTILDDVTYLFGEGKHVRFIDNQADTNTDLENQDFREEGAARKM